jgi:hypothetical protein
MNKILCLVLGFAWMVSAGIAADTNSTTGDENAATDSGKKNLKKWQRKYDINRDGALDHEENQAMVKALDKNGNGKVDKDEVPNKGAKKAPSASQ